MRCHHAVLVVGLAAVVVLVCRGVLVLGFFLNDYDVKNNNQSSPRGGSSSGGATNTLYNELLTLRLEDIKGRRRKEAHTSNLEAVMVAVHVKKSSQSTSSSPPSDDKYDAGVSSSFPLQTRKMPALRLYTGAALEISQFQFLFLQTIQTMPR